MYTLIASFRDHFEYNCFPNPTPPWVMTLLMQSSNYYEAQSTLIHEWKCRSSSWWNMKETHIQMSLRKVEGVAWHLSWLLSRFNVTFDGCYCQRLQPHHHHLKTNQERHYGLNVSDLRTWKWCLTSSSIQTLLFKRIRVSWASFSSCKKWKHVIFFLFSGKECENWINQNNDCLLSLVISSWHVISAGISLLEVTKRVQDVFKYPSCLTKYECYSAWEANNPFVVSIAHL